MPPGSTTAAVEKPPAVRVSLWDMLGWFVACGAFFAVMTAGPGIWWAFVSRSTVTRNLGFEAPPPSPWTLGLCWGILLFAYLKRRELGLVMIHVAPALTGLLPLIADSPDRLTVGPYFALSMLWISAAVSFPLYLWRTASRIAESELHPLAYAAMNMIALSIIFALICGLPASVIRRAPDLPAAIYGALLGVWFGLHQTAATSPRFTALRPWGIPLRPAINAGLWAALLGPLVYWWFVERQLGLYPIPGRLLPLMGLPFALAAGLFARWRESRRIPSI